jgi:hypothetical protein
MSTIKVNKLEQRSGCTATVGGGAGKTVTVDATTVTLGRCGGTVSLASGASQSGFGRTGTVDWCTTAKTSPFTSVSGKGYFVNTSGGAVTVTLPASPSAGDIVSIADLNGTFDTNAVTLNRNSSKIKGACSNLDLKDERMSATVIYSGASQGWIAIDNANVCGATLKPQTYNVQYFVVAGGGGGASSQGGVGHGGGGAGGFRTIACKSFSVNAGDSIPITVGAGGAGGLTGSCAWPGIDGCNGSNSIFSTITSTGGGGGAAGFPGPSSPPQGNGLPGGSGGGGGKCTSSGSNGRPGGSGNTPPVSPSQGNDGGPGNNGPNSQNGGGGGGAGAVGQPGGTSPNSGFGGAGSASTIFGSSPIAPSYGVAPNPSNTGPGRYFAGGGGGGWTTDSDGGYGGGGGTPGTAGTTNTGGGGGAGHIPSPYAAGGAGGSGIVVIRHLTADGGSGGNATGTCGSDTIRVFTGSGTFTA